MKSIHALLAAILLAAPLAGVAQDQPLYPVLMDSGNVIIRPNPQVFATANRLVMTSDALYSFITNETLVAATTGTVETVAGLSETITNIPAASVTSGNLAVARITNAAATVGSYIGGNIPVAAMTNAAGSIGASIGGNIPVAAMTNAAGSIGASIGGNVPIASLTNALATNLGTVDYTNVIVTADAKTNTIIVINGLVTSWIVTE